MTYQDLYSFFTTKARELDLKIEQLPELCGISRSSLYRYMKAISPIPAKIEKEFARVLQLSDDEKEMFHELIELSMYDQTLLQARTALDEVIFGKSDQPLDPVHCVLYADDKYFRSLDEIFAEVLTLTSQPGFSCDIKILNCIDPPVLRAVAAFAQQLEQRGAVSAVEHLLSLVEGDYSQITHAFLSIISTLSLISYPNYTARYNMVDSLHGQKGLFENTILLTIESGTAGAVSRKCYWFSMLKEQLSSCLVFTGEHLYTLLTENYRETRRQYQSLLCDTKGISTVGEEMLDLSAGTAHYLIKPNSCFDKIPYEQYLSLLPRCTPEILNSLNREISEGRVFSMQAVEKQYLAYLRKRIDLTFTTAHTDVYSVDGLTEFAKTGKITDHLRGMPAFTKEERKAILENLRDRNLDKKDSYRMFLTERPILENGLIFIIGKGKGILVQQIQERYRSGVYHNIFVNNQDLETVFIDYIENHLIRNHTMSTEEATQAINLLITRYCA